MTLLDREQVPEQSSGILQGDNCIAKVTVDGMAIQSQVSSKIARLLLFNIHPFKNEQAVSIPILC